MRSQLARGLAAASVALLTVGLLAGCSADAGDDEPVEVGELSLEGAPTRWWETPRSAAGSEIDAADPEAGARSLSPDRDAYCAILEQTAERGEGFIPADIDPANENYVAASSAFVHEVQALAPAEVREDWETYGAMLLALFESGGDIESLLLPDALTAEQIDAAAVAIDEDARARCGLTP